MLCVLHSTYHICIEDQKYFPKLSPFASWPRAMINTRWLELPMSRTNFYGPKDVRANEVRLYIIMFWYASRKQMLSVPI